MAIPMRSIDNENAFRAWLRVYHHQNERLVGNTIARCRRINRDLGDIHVAYDNDRCAHMLRQLTYTIEDAHNHRAAPGNLVFKGDKNLDVFYAKTLREGLATLRKELEIYCQFRESGLGVGKDSGDGTTSGDGASFDMNAIAGEYHKWLIAEAGLKKTSADQYKVYIKKLCVAIDKAFGAGWFESLRTDLDKIASIKRHQCSAFIEFNVRETSKAARKTWNDWRSAFHQFEEFLDDVSDVWNPELGEAWKIKKPAKIKIVPPTVDLAARAYVDNGEVNPNAIAATYTHKELVRIFVGRLKTQSRWYPSFGLLFPTRLLTRIFRNKRPNAWIEWLKGGIENMRVLKSANGAFVRFSEVTGMTIQCDGTVKVFTKSGASFNMMTRTAENGIDCEKALRGLRDVSIDHVVSLENVLRKNQGKLIGLRRLAELFASCKQECGIELDARSERTWVDDFFARFKAFADTEEMRTLIISDLRVLDLEYELMDTHENSKKGKGR